MYRVIATDLDGTLCRDDHSIDERTKAFIDEMIDRGFRFVVVTGRNFQMVHNSFGDWRPDCYYIVTSGGEVRNSKGKQLFKQPIEKTKVKEVVDTLKKYGCDPFLQAEDAEYAVGEPDVLINRIRKLIPEEYKDMSVEEIKNSKMYKTFFHRSQILSPESWYEELDRDVFKIDTFCDEPDRLEKLKNVINNEIEGVVEASSFGNNAEITAESAQKGIVLKKLIEKLGYSMDEVMVFGDSFNDYSMLSMDFGATVAMGNSMPGLSKVTKYKTITNEEHGVEYAVRMMLDGKLEELRYR